MFIMDLFVNNIVRMFLRKESGLKMKIGVALSGGGIKGIAHAGVLKAFEENDIKIDVIGGTSSGSLVATLYAMGYSPRYIYLLFQRYAKDIVSMDFLPLFNGMSSFIKNKKFQIVGFNNGKKLENEYNSLAMQKGIENISDIKMPLVIPTVDINSAKEYVFTNYIPDKEDKDKYISDIPIGLAVRASSSFPRSVLSL